MQSRHRSKVLKQHFETCALMALRQFALFLVYEIVEISSREQERTWTSSLLPASPSAINAKKGVKSNAFIYLRLSTARHK